jgi:hypothetical protein
MIVRLRTVLAAGARVDNILAGKSIEFAPEDSKLTIAMATTAAGITVSARLTDEVIVDEGSSVPVKTGGEPVIPDDVITASQPVARGDHLLISLFNSTAGSLTVVSMIEVAPL